MACNGTTVTYVFSSAINGNCPFANAAKAALANGSCSSSVSSYGSSSCNNSYSASSTCAKSAANSAMLGHPDLVAPPPVVTPDSNTDTDSKPVVAVLELESDTIDLSAIEDAEDISSPPLSSVVLSLNAQSDAVMTEVVADNAADEVGDILSDLLAELDELSEMLDDLAIAA